MKILALDPGKLSGFAWLNTDDLTSFTSWMLPHMEALNDVWAHVEARTVDLIVCESFIITAQTLKKSRGENWSLEQIGATRWMCSLHDIPFELQSPADAKSFVDDRRLSDVGWRKTGPGHDNDAARHLLLAVARYDSGVFKELLAKAH